MLTSIWNVAIMNQKCNIFVTNVWQYGICMGGNKMSKTTRRISVAVMTVSLAATTAFGVIKANSIYDDSNTGISSVLDRYAESVQLDTTENTTSVRTEEQTTTESAKTADKKNSKKTAKEDKTVSAQAEEVTCKYPQFKDRCLTTVSDSVNIRATASEDGELVGTLAANGIALVKEKGDTWTKIASGNCEGYIKNDYLMFGDDAGAYAEEHCSKLATITTETLNVREQADGDSNCVTQIPGGQTYEVLSQSDGWTQLQIDDSVSGYVSSDYVEISYNTVKAVTVEEAEAARIAAEEEAKRKQEEAEAERQRQQQAAQNSSSGSGQSSDNSSSSSSQTTETPATEAPSTPDPVPSSGSTGVDLANYALQFVGNPYVYGGTSLTNGADCSGFTLSVYAHFGISLPHSATAQSYYGTEVSLSELEPGDLLFYGSEGDIGHVAIYTGGGMVVHASTEATGIKTSVYNYRTPVKAVRLLGQ